MGIRYEAITGFCFHRRAEPFIEPCGLAESSVLVFALGILDQRIDLHAIDDVKKQVVEKPVDGADCAGNRTDRGDQRSDGTGLGGVSRRAPEGIGVIFLDLLPD